MLTQTQTVTAGLLRAVEDEHGGCIVCGEENAQGWHLDYVADTDQSIVAELKFSEALQGYRGVVHGGVVAAVLDGAMTHALFVIDRVAFTAELKVRYLHPVLLQQPARVRAWIKRSTPRLELLEANLTQDGRVKTKAWGKFMIKPPLP